MYTENQESYTLAVLMGFVQSLSCLGDETTLSKSAAVPLPTGAIYGYAPKNVVPEAQGKFQIHPVGHKLSPM